MTSSATINGNRALVSVLTPCFNESASTLSLSLESLRAQSFRDFECLVVDDSTNPERAAAAKAACALDDRFVYIHPPQRIGLAAGLNLALTRARGQLIARFDADDVCMPTRLEKQVAFLHAHPGVSVVGTALQIIDENGKPVAIRRYPTEHAAIARRMQFSAALSHSAVMIRKEVFDKWGDYNPSFRFAEDLDLWLRFLNEGVRFSNLEEPLVCYRQASTGRAAGHWSHNLKARTRNFSAALWPQRVLGIGVIAAWACLPQSARALIYRQTMFRDVAKSQSL